MKSVIQFQSGLSRGLSTGLLKSEKAYNGKELRPHFLLTEMGLKGSALGAFIGPCFVATEHLVDWEDRLQNDRIEAASMVHFLGEFFGASLREGVLAQRLFMATLQQIICDLRGEFLFTREGDDLYLLPSKDVASQTSPPPAGERRKLSVSIVTASPVSQLLHVGINIDPAGAPVPAVGLKELGISPEIFIEKALHSFSEEWLGIEWACAKVRPVV